MTLDHIKVSQQARDQLIKLKRSTGIQNWNVLCRWAFCLSLSEPSIPSPVRIPADSSVEMTWKVFGGKFHDIYLALLKERCHRDGVEISDESMANQFRLHLHRGIAHLASDKSIRDTSGLISLIH